MSSNIVSFMADHKVQLTCDDDNSIVFTMCCAQYSCHGNNYAVD